MTPLKNIEKKIPDLSLLEPSLSRQFNVRRYKDCRLLWLNDRWLYDNGIDSRNPKIRRDLEVWLIEEFGVGAPSKDQPHKQFIGGPTQMYADRYGGTNGAIHGGSGRCGYKGRFNAKGIGRTPLVSDYIDKAHKNGFLPLSEAISEAIFSEITHIETQYGSIPILAILSTGHEYKFRDDREAEACGIVVRPNFVRPAHFERSIFFGQSGAAGSDQFIDASRAKTAIQTATCRSRESNIDFKSVEDMFMRFARQVGTSRANRLWQGQFLSSNMSVCGAFVDFGSFRSVYGWQQAIGLSSQVFGKEAISMLAAYESLKFQFDKYLDRPKFHSKDFFLKFKSDVSKEIELSFRSACEQAIISNNNLPLGRSNISEILIEYYNQQQKSRYQLSDGSGEWAVRRPWLLHALNGLNQNKHPYGRQEVDVASAIKGSLVKSSKSVTDSERLSYQSLLAWLKPRPLLFHEVISRKTYGLSRKITTDENFDNQRISVFIKQSLRRNLLYWMDKPSGFHAIGQATDGQSFAVYGYVNTHSNPKLWLHGHIVEDQVLLFDHRFDVGNLKKYNPKIYGNKITLLLDYNINEVTHLATSLIGDTVLNLPRAQRN